MEEYNENSRFISILSDYGFKATFGNEADTTFLKKALQALIDSPVPIKSVEFVKNDISQEKRYYNGKIGVISFIDENKIKVKSDEDTSEIEVSKEVWTNISYKVDRKTKRIDEEILGTFSQYPLRLAWAITIHKSQGLTFEKLIIDAAESFSAGQFYVALRDRKSVV